jgi:hypothetical protein
MAARLLLTILIQCLHNLEHSNLDLTYGCRVPLFRREREHHILDGALDSSPGVGRDSHVQLGVRCTHLVVPCAMQQLKEDQ